MTKAYTDDETKAWRAAQPQKMVVAKVVIKSDKGNVLLAKPDYKKSWQLPGGGVEAGESPEEAAVREAKEELGFTVALDSLAIKGTIYKKDEEILFVIYESRNVVPEDVALTPQEGEITGFRFVNPAEAASLLSPYYADFWRQNYEV
jgi:8-oxo-dGTP pyrophosphatase MutT (NUDIX family)